MWHNTIQYTALYFLLYRTSLYVKFGLQTYSHRAIPPTQRSSERVWGCWHISNTIVNNYDMTVKPYYQHLGISVRSCKHSCLAFLWNAALGRQEKEGMSFPFRRDHRLLAQSHSNQFFLGGPLYLWLWWSPVASSPALQQLGCIQIPTREILASGM